MDTASTVADLRKHLKEMRKMLYDLESFANKAKELSKPTLPYNDLYQGVYADMRHAHIKLDAATRGIDWGIEKLEKIETKIKETPCPTMTATVTPIAMETPMSPTPEAGVA